LLTTLVMTPGGTPRHELLAFLKSIPEVELTWWSRLEGPNIEWPGCLPTIDLVIFAIYAHDYGDWSMLKATRDRLPNARCLALVSSPRQMEGALASGADRVLLAGFSTLEFFKTLQEIDLIKGILPKGLQ